MEGLLFKYGPVRPVDAVYGITTSSAVRVSLETYAMFGGAELAESASIAVDYYSDDFTISF